MAQTSFSKCPLDISTCISPFGYSICMYKLKFLFSQISFTLRLVISYSPLTPFFSLISYFQVLVKVDKNTIIWFVSVPFYSHCCHLFPCHCWLVPTVVQDSPNWSSFVQSVFFFGLTNLDTEAEAPILWPSDAKNWLIGKDADAGKDWRQEQKGTTEDEMVG